jgi:hypothetical protein
MTAVSQWPWAGGWRFVFRASTDIGYTVSVWYKGSPWVITYLQPGATWFEIEWCCDHAFFRPVFVQAWKMTSHGPLHGHNFFLHRVSEPSSCSRTRDEFGRVSEFSTRLRFNGNCDHEVLRKTWTVVAHPGIKPVVDAFYRLLVYFSCLVLMSSPYSPPLDES